MKLTGHRAPRLVWFAWLLGWLAGLGWVYAESAVRQLPGHYTPAKPFTVYIEVTAEAGTLTQLVEDHLPSGWTASSVSHGGVWDAANRAVKWGPFSDATTRLLSYVAQPPPGLAPVVTFVGEANFDSRRVPITGEVVCSGQLGTLVRSVQPRFLPGEAIPVVLTATPEPAVEGWAVEESVPAGWTVSGVSHGGVFDPFNRKLKWGPFSDATSLTLGFTLTSPETQRESVELQALAYFDVTPTTDITTLRLVESQLRHVGPTNYLPREIVPITIEVTPAPYVRVLTVEEPVPVGWIPDSFSHGGVFDVRNRKVKWSLVTDAPIAPFSLTYTLLPPERATNTFVLPALGILEGIEATAEHPLRRRLAEPFSTVERFLPPNYTNGIPVPVRLEARPIDTALVYAVIEKLPVGWTVVSISPGGAFDPFHRQIKWGPFFDEIATPRTLTYALMPAPKSIATVLFNGIARFDQTDVLVTGPDRINPPLSRIRRTAPPSYTPTVPFIVSLTTQPVEGTYSYAVEEQVPEGWLINGISDGGAWDPFTRRIKWGPFTDENLRTLKYALTPPANATGPRALSGRGFFNTEWVPADDTTPLTLNQPPQPEPDTITRHPDQPTKISVFKLVENDRDSEGNFLQVVGVTRDTEEGGTVALIWPWIYYTPPPGPPANDRFDYQVKDSLGAVSTSTVTILLYVPPEPPARNIIAVEPTVAGQMRLRFAGIPGLTYRIEVTEDLIQWTQAATAQAGPTGEFIWVDPDSSAQSFRLYRTISP